MSDVHRDSEDSAQFAFDGLDRVLHEKSRLGILSSLMANPQGLLFGELKELCALTDGNLNRHMQVLQDARLVDAWKGSLGSRPQTLFRMTEAGQERFMEYIGVLERIVSDAMDASRVNQKAAKGRRTGWGFSPA